MSQEVVSNKFANPSPLGLLGFGMTTILLNLANAGIVPLTSVVVAMGFALGGLAQLIAGIVEYKNGNLFGATAFTSYATFWWSLIFIWWNPSGAIPADEMSMGFYLLLWAVYTLFMAIATLKHNRATQIVFFSLTVLFVTLSLADFTGIHLIKNIAGYIGIFCGLSAVYNSVAQIINHEYKKNILPL